MPLPRPSQLVAAAERRAARSLRSARARLRAARPGRDDDVGEPTEEPLADPYVALQRALDAELSRPVPTPPGMDVADVDAMMRSFALDGGPVGALDPYVADSLWRFLHTWDLVRGLDGSALELGANPYFTTVLLQDHTRLDLTLANYFGEGRPDHARQTVRYTTPDGVDHERAMAFDHFDIEHDPFPYADASFDVVLFCEIVEHLLEDPVAALDEINRVLRPGGALVLTTPNVVRLENVLRLVVGENIYDPYSGHGPYGRHNREYDERDLRVLLDFTGFSVERSFTSDSHPWAPTRPELAPELAPHLAPRLDALGHYQFVLARKERPGRTGRPSWLYRSLPPGELVDVPIPS